MIELAESYVQAGISVIPLRLDGSKSPLVQWNQYRKRFATDAEVNNWFRNDDAGIGLVCGVLSGGLEVLDFDAGELFYPWKRKVESIVNRLAVIETPSFGYHVIYRCCEVTGNHKIAIDPNIEKHTLIESRGEGGYIVGCGSPLSVHHADFPYVQVAGPPLPELTTITRPERISLWAAARSFSKVDMYEEKLSEYQKSKRLKRIRNPSSGNTPWDDFNRRTDWFDILQPLGWKTTDGEHWTRPGKSKGTSAAVRKTNDGTAEVLVVFSSNCDLDAGTGHKTYSKFGAYAGLMHSGDRKAAARQLRSEGFGKE